MSAYDRMPGEEESLAVKDNIEKPKYTIAQTYVKDVSFENPFFLDMMNKVQEEKPDIKFNLEVKVNQGDAVRFEVVIIVKLDVIIAEKAYIQSEIVYAALVQLAEGVDQQEVLFVDIPHQIYPEIRPLVSQLFQLASAMSAFKLPIVDFKSLYERRLKERAEEEKKGKKITKDKAN